MKISISTLGEFDIKSDGQSILRQSSRTYRLNKLFEYFITFRNKKLLPEMIIDNLLAESESDDPKNMLRTQIFRLRKIIKAFLPDGADESEYLMINFVNGYYCLEIGEKTEIDVDEFEALIHRGDMDMEHDPESAARLYLNAIKLYKGLYLSDNAYEVWLVPTRNYYQRLYLKTLRKLIELLKEKNENETVIGLCEEALLVDPYEESIHINLMEAMLHQGQQKNALNHYEYSMKLLMRELDIKPSWMFTEMLNKIQNHVSKDNPADFNSINSELEDENLLGAMQCNIDSFKFLLNLQKRKSFRNDENDYLCIMNINDSNSRKSKELTEILRYSLRKGDVFTYWNQSQVLMILHDVKDGGIDVVRDRIYSKIRNSSLIKERDVNFSFKPLMQEEPAV